MEPKARFCLKFTGDDGYCRRCNQLLEATTQVCTVKAGKRRKKSPPKYPLVEVPDLRAVVRKTKMFFVSEQSFKLDAIVMLKEKRSNIRSCLIKITSAESIGDRTVFGFQELGPGGMR
jgi:hypothetical protein